MISREIENQFLFKDAQTGVEVWMKRLDRLLPDSIGNKYFKLKYNLEEARKLNCDTLLTFGGAFSNHIAATASLGKEMGFKTIGVIRGEELKEKIQSNPQENPTLSQAIKNGMQLEFVSREKYREKHNPEFLDELRNKFGEVYILPEGGTNELAIKGCTEILRKEDKEFDYITVSVGTGGTLSGIIQSLMPGQRVLGFSALNHDMKKEVAEYVQSEDYDIFPDSKFGGFGKINEELVSFINRFNENYGILLDPLYNGKMMFGLMKKIEENYFKKNSRILAIHTGGLQGIDGVNNKLIKKGLTTIKK